MDLSDTLSIAAFVISVGGTVVTLAYGRGRDNTRLAHLEELQRKSEQAISAFQSSVEASFKGVDKKFDEQQARYEVTDRGLAAVEAVLKHMVDMIGELRGLFLRTPPTNQPPTPNENTRLN